MTSETAPPDRRAITDLLKEAPCQRDPDEPQFIKHEPSALWPYRCKCGYQWLKSHEVAVKILEKEVLRLSKELASPLPSTREPPLINGPAGNAAHKFVQMPVITRLLAPNQSPAVAREPRAQSEQTEIEQNVARGLIRCPFCGDGDFDKIGLKFHLGIGRHCDEFERTKSPFEDCD